MSETLKQKTAKGLLWGALNSGTTQVLNLVIGICLARLLSPEEYGIVGVLTIFTAIAGDLQSAGFTQGLVNMKRPASHDYNAVFTFNVMMSAVMYTILFFSAPLIAAFFKQPCLTDVSRLLFLTFVIASLGIAHGGYMTKNMMNREMAIIGAVALIASGTVGIALALYGASYWALAWQQIAYIGVLNAGRYYYVRQWRPRITFNLAPVVTMAPFALKILVTKIVNTVSNHVLTVFFGRLFSMHDVGSYSQAFKWDTMAHSIVSNTVGQIAQAVLVEADNETHSADRNLRVYRKMLRFTCFLSMPLMFGLALVGHEFIILTIGEEWLGCVPMLQILSISGAFMPIYIMYQNLSVSQGRSDIFMWLNIGQIVMQALIIAVCWRYGMYVMVTAYSVLIVLWIVPWHHFAGRLIGYSWHQLIRDIIPFTIAAAIVMVVTHYITRSISMPLLLISARVPIAALLYYTIMKLSGAEILKECERFLIGKMRK